jgi:hypothetical protein
MYITYEHDGFVIEQYNSIICQQFLVYTFSYITSPISINSLLFRKEYNGNNICLQV